MFRCRESDCRSHVCFASGQQPQHRPKQHQRPNKQQRTESPRQLALDLNLRVVNRRQLATTQPPVIHQLHLQTHQLLETLLKLLLHLQQLSVRL